MLALSLQTALDTAVISFFILNALEHEAPAQPVSSLKVERKRNDLLNDDFDKNEEGLQRLSAEEEEM